MVDDGEGKWGKKALESSSNVLLLDQQLLQSTLPLLEVEQPSHVHHSKRVHWGSNHMELR